ncbi:hypothetical protein [Pseudalkalibacillus berkeleyi]|uniref:Uncharacterized protein n=1 Tax=Pseudalkalibacillus berkeleyi TaxID=1069813 RepID=A0ABS9H005_9BACL|nr:hypothetical protein [Pseudalkalibacillus berkeleyi]MCF6138264.1 hypothetical protein [Pseudalkalibacillus berkeleyi]
MLMIIIVGILLTYKGLNDLYIKKTFNKPYTIASEIIQDAIQDKRKSKYILSNQEWKSMSEESVFILTREPIDWTDFKGFIQSCTGPNTSLSYNDGKAAFKVMKQEYKDNDQRVYIMCHEYDEVNGDHKASKTITLLMEKIDGAWKAVGKSSEKK